MQACDVHRSKGTPLDGGPPCAIIFEEPQLAEAAYWQTGVALSRFKLSVFTDLSVLRLHNQIRIFVDESGVKF